MGMLAGQAACTFDGSPLPVGCPAGSVTIVRNLVTGGWIYEGALSLPALPGIAWVRFHISQDTFFTPG